MPNPSSNRRKAGRRRVLIVDDHPVMRRGLAALIEGESDLAVCGEAATCAQALAAIRRYCPELVIVDLSLEEGDGMALIKDMAVRFPEIPALVLSMHDEALFAERALRAGARGYVTKHEMGETVLTAIRRVLAGQRYVSAATSERFVEGFLHTTKARTDSPLKVLSDRELQVYRRLGEGMSTNQIAGEMRLSIKTVESHRERIKAKLGLKSGSALVRHAVIWVLTGEADSEHPPSIKE